MNKDYKISNDGTIFEIKEDGSISKIARIDDNGNILSVSGTIDRPQQGGKGKYWFFIILFLIYDFHQTTERERKSNSNISNI